MRLQKAYLSCYRILHDPADLSLAVENFRLASGHATQGFPERIKAALRWVAAAEEHNHASGLETYTTFFNLFDGHFATRSSTISRHEAAAAFHYVRSLPVAAASCAIRHVNLRQAVELVQQGRGHRSTSTFNSHSRLTPAGLQACTTVHVCALLKPEKAIYATRQPHHITKVNISQCFRYDDRWVTSCPRR
ncbi:uncharacterized protein HD556DRAFT_220852 [Suillus plorans]|uniref:Uncharacterized protein n=1 Tax=Suillus plorans TaxID=116603 RepID=A0A9P7DLW9_9AGAM|nr:uncharacterized protein HD556DRAFT_220852 [Suillus plorans]KAG1798114.1 hypothetical protein HD556DRAFT_220852 [Suillus plorans]